MRTSSIKAVAFAGLGMAAAACGTTGSAVLTPNYPSRTAETRPSAEATPPARRTETPRGEYGLYTEKVGRPYVINGREYTPAHQPRYDETGIASWYGDYFHGKPTATGEPFDMNGISAAHKTLPLNALVEVTNLENGRSLVMRVNDRGPFVDGRIIDLSKGAAEELGTLRAGVARVRVRYLGAAPLDAPPNFRRDEEVRYARAEPAPVRAPEPPAPIAPATGDFAVQAGSFSQYANAERAAEQVSAVGVPEIQPLNRNGGTLYRVLVVGLSSAEDAARAREAVASRGFADARVIAP